MPASKVAISLPEPLLRLIDDECRRLRMTRSEFIRGAIKSTFERLDERAADDAYVTSYLKDPEDPTITAAFGTLAAEALAEDPWE